ncbi:hypothetical protein GQ600_2108 [Phytophthora cactorum]|nr:hypothetical protein GQ600_2108 [Phytophthora cactorum]
MIPQRLGEWFETRLAETEASSLSPVKKTKGIHGDGSFPRVEGTADNMKVYGPLWGVELVTINSDKEKNQEQVESHKRASQSPLSRCDVCLISLVQYNSNTTYSFICLQPLLSSSSDAFLTPNTASRQRNPLCLTADTDVTSDATAILLLHAEIDKRVLAEYTFGVQIGSQEVRVPAQRCRRRHATHVCLVDHVLQELEHVRELRVHSHLVLPLELGPHRTEGCVCARGWLDVVHDVQMNVVQVHIRLLSS